jgi:hypothetical protein
LSSKENKDIGGGDAEQNSVEKDSRVAGRVFKALITSLLIQAQVRI